MWSSLSVNIFRYRIPVFISLLLLTGFMAYHAAQVELTYNFPKIIPEDHPAFIRYNEIKSEFGDDGSIMVMGVSSPAVYDAETFRLFKRMGDSVNTIEGVTNVISPAHAFNLVKNTSKRALELQPIHSGVLSSNEQVDSIWKVFKSIPIYEGLLHDSATSTAIMAITFSQSALDSEQRLVLTDEILHFSDQFESATGLEVRHSGLPFMRSFNMTTIRFELTFFLILAVITLSILLLILFRSFLAMLFSLIVVCIGAVWSLGTIHLLGYNITILTGLLPTLVVVIGIPNCIYLLNKIHAEFRKHRNLRRSIIRSIEKVGSATFFTNLTTAIGFGVFVFTRSEVLQEFGLVAFIDILAMFFISLVGIPIVFSFLPPPGKKQLRHLDRKGLSSLIAFFERIVQNKRRRIYLAATVIFIAALAGFLQLQSKGYVLDDVPKTSKVYSDLMFFEEALDGVLPFDLIIENPEKGKLNSMANFKKMAMISDSLAQLDVLSKGFSAADGARLASFAFYNGNPKKYKVPSSFELSNPRFRSYINNTKADASVLGNAFMNDSNTVARVAFQLSNRIGSDSLPQFIDSLQPYVNEVFPPEEGYKTEFNGTTVISLVGFQFLIDGLVQSVVLSFILIAIIMALMFKNFRMLLIALVPNVLPLLITAGIMGWSGINLKPSTVLIFSIAFGISVDYTIHFLAKYRQELGRNISLTETVLSTIRETGISMVYTSIILFFGFIVFVFSEFQGTSNMGLLTSIALFVSLFCNLIFLPALLIGYDNKRKTKTTDGTISSTKAV